jgi:DNA-binding transcriptional ArsR family regulator
MLSAIATDPRGESCVCDLADLAEVSQPTVSHHLKVLKETGMLLSERRGTWVYYRIAPGKRAPSRPCSTRSLPPRPSPTSPRTPQHGPRPCSRWTPA